MTQADLARALGVTQQTASDLERNASMASEKRHDKSSDRSRQPHPARHADAGVRVVHGATLLSLRGCVWTLDRKALLRLPQEDMCQATGTSPLAKYEADGGPGMDRILGPLESSGERERDRVNLFRAQLLFWLLCAPDGHAKNFSIHLDPRGKNPHRMMRDVLRHHWNESARRNGIGDSAEAIMAELLDKTPQVIEQVACKLPKQLPALRGRQRLFWVAGRCSATCADD